MTPQPPIDEHVFVSSDGTEHHFPGNMDMGKMKETVANYEQDLKRAKRYNIPVGQFQQDMANYGKGDGPVMDKVINIARPMGLAPALTAGTEAAAALPLPPAGKALGGALVGAGTYMGLDTLLQHLLSKPPGSLNESLNNSAINAAETEGLSALGRGGYSKLKGLINEAKNPGSIAGKMINLEPTYSQYPDTPGKGVAKFVENTFAPGSKNAAIENSGRLGMELGQDKAAGIAGQSKTIIQNPQSSANILKNEISVSQGGGTTPPKAIANMLKDQDSPIPHINNIIDDPNRLQDTLTTGSAPLMNIKKKLGGYQLNRMLQESVTTDPINPANKTFNPQALMDKWNDPAWQNSKKLLYSKTQQDDIGDFLKGIASTQTGAPSNGIARIGLVRGALYLSPSLIAHTLAGGGIGTAVTGVELGAGALGKLLTNPKLARLMVAMAKGEPLGVSEVYASRIISAALKGETVNLMGPHGEKQAAMVGEGGLEPVGW